MYLKLIEAENVGLTSEVTRNRYDWVPAFVSHCDLGCMQSFMNVYHECVEMDASFAVQVRGQGIVK